MPLQKAGYSTMCECPQCSKNSTTKLLPKAAHLQTFTPTPSSNRHPSSFTAPLQKPAHILRPCSHTFELQHLGYIRSERGELTSAFPQVGKETSFKSRHPKRPCFHILDAPTTSKQKVPLRRNRYPISILSSGLPVLASPT